MSTPQAKLLLAKAKRAPSPTEGIKLATQAARVALKARNRALAQEAYGYAEGLVSVVGEIGDAAPVAAE